jgi:DNA-directed RNA polymerase subunit beta
MEVFEEKRVRKRYGKIVESLEIPHLLEVQLSSYQKLLQKEIPPEERKDIGIQKVFKQIFPVKDFYETAELRFVKYRIDEPKYDVDECIVKGLTYAAPLRVTVQLVIYDVQEGVKTGQTKVIKEHEVYFGEIPLMTHNGCFVINGTKRVVVNQLHRSPGVFYDQEMPSAYAGRPIYTARIIPYRGSWLDFEFDQKDLVYVRIDRRRKIPATVLLKAAGYSTEDLLREFYGVEKVIIREGTFWKKVTKEALLGEKAPSDVVNPRTGEVIVKKGRRINEVLFKKIEEAGIQELPIEEEVLLGSVAASDIVDPESKKIIVEVNEELTPERLKTIKEKGVKEFEIIKKKEEERIAYGIRETLLIDPVRLTLMEREEAWQKEDPLKEIRRLEQEKALIEIYRRMRPGEPPILETARAFFYNLFFNPERYDLSPVGRMKLNHKLGLQVPYEVTVLRPQDLLEVVKYLVSLAEGKGSVDDIDHLGNRRVRTVGELVENQFYIGLNRVAQAIKEKMSIQDVEFLMPQDLVNSKPLTATLKEFFGSGQLSQFMDQTNPLSETTHKRRLSALGPGGLSRERAGFEARDVHPSHYGRICPIETPEGPNIGLIVSLTTYARINEFGFIETPYRKVVNGRLTDEIHYLYALDEEKYTITHSKIPVDETGRITADLVQARRGGEYVMVKPEELDYVDVSPKQVVSVSASLIPFLEHDDANRALMGSNMQRQAVPLLKPQAPLIGTGMEKIVARDSGATVVAKRSGVVESVDSRRIVIRAEENGQVVGVDIYNLIKFQRSNQGTCINQRPIVRKGEKVQKGQVIADGPSTELGELALGKNVLVAFMPWGGYNFEDSILVSEKLLKEDTFTSVHIEEFECVARETKLGREEITRDIPNVSEEQLRNLDESGIIRIGAEVKPGDILVGKVTPKGETQLTPEERLLRAIFGEKAADVKDTSLRVPHGIEGVVIDTKVLTRRGLEKDKRAKEMEEAEKAQVLEDMETEQKIIEDFIKNRVLELLEGKRLSRSWERLPQGTVLTKEVLKEIPWKKWKDIPVDPEIAEEVNRLIEKGLADIQEIERRAKERIKKIEAGDELPPGVLKVVKVYVAMKRKLSVGDKLTGRHGNKGIVSRILPEEDMPFLEDGTPVEMVLNPLGVPSRMNLGQILETHLGWAAKGLGERVKEFLKGGEVALKEEEVEELRNFLLEIFSEPEVKEALRKATKEQLISFAQRLKDGIFMTVPVFDGATEEEIRFALIKAGLPPEGQVVLYDGRTGEPFDQKVTVGYMYMLKLHHLVDDKIHARSIGPYSLITQQPLGGKAQFGGQRLGEMEVWALEAYGAAYSLQEFLTVKSDDVGGRTRTYEAIVKGKTEILDPGIPESFNVIIKELQGLCLNVEVIEKEKEIKK